MSCQRLTQNERLLAYLKRHRFITRAPAFSKLGIANLWARAAELNELLAPRARIEGRWTKTRAGARVLQYWLVEGRKRAA